MCMKSFLYLMSIEKEPNLKPEFVEIWNLNLTCVINKVSLLQESEAR